MRARRYFSRRFSSYLRGGFRQYRRGSLCSLSSASTRVLVPKPTFDLFSEVGLVRHELVYMHDFWFGSSVALYPIHDRTDFGQHQPGASIFIAEFTTTDRGVNSLNPVATLETRVTTGLAIASLLPFSSSLEIGSGHSMGIPNGAT